MLCHAAPAHRGVLVQLLDLGQRLFSQAVPIVHFHKVAHIDLHGVCFVFGGLFAGGQGREDVGGRGVRGAGVGTGDSSVQARQAQDGRDSKG